MRLLIVDDDIIFCNGLKVLLENEGFSCQIAFTGSECIRHLQQAPEQIDAILLDQRLPDCQGTDILKDIRAITKHAAIILMTMYSDTQLIQSAIARGIDGYIQKPFELAHLIRTLRASLTSRKHQRHPGHTTYNVPSDFLINVVESLPGGLIIADEHFQPQLINERATQILGLSYHDIDAELIRKTFIHTGVNPDRLFRRTIKFKQKVIAYTLIPFYYMGKRLGTLINFQDITQFEQKRRRLAQQRRLALLGRIASGIAHEIGNPVAAMKATVQVLMKNYNSISKDRIYDYIARIQREINHIETLLNDFLTYARYRAPAWRRIHLLKATREVLQDMEDMFEKHRIKLDLPDTSQDYMVWMDTTMFQQTLYNILMNAIQACQEGKGQIRINAFPKGEWTYLVVQDNGHGMSADLLKQVFEPFFTTKPNGTGLGLSICRVLMRQMGGDIYIRSRLHKGTQVRLKFWSGINPPSGQRV